MRQIWKMEGRMRRIWKMEVGGGLEMGVSNGREDETVSL